MSTSTHSSRWARLAQLIWTAERYTIGATLGLWLGDAVMIAASRGGASWVQWVEGMGAAAFVATSTALVLGALLGPALVPVARELADRGHARWAALRSTTVETRHALLARVLAAPVLLVLWAGAVYEVTTWALFSFARPETTAAAMAAGVTVLVAVFLAAWPWVVRAGMRLVDGMSRVHGLRWLVDTPWRLPGAFVLSGMIASAVVVVLTRQLLASLPWHDAAPLLGVGLGLSVAITLPRAPTWIRRGALGLTVLVFAGGFALALRLRPESSVAQDLAFERALSGRTGYLAWTLVLDFDRDGQINVLGGGDCAPFDPKRYTGAPDVPGNGIDEDCDGSDMSLQSLGVRPPMPVPPGTLPTHPSVVFVTVDALTALRLAGIGGHRQIMPRLDELASRSLLFTHCFSQGPSTRMSFPSIFTSRWDSQQQFEYTSRAPYSFSDKERTLQDAFDDAGYETAAVIPNVYFSRLRWASLTKGFQRVDDSALTSRSGKHNAVEVTDAALRILSEQRAQPLYLWVHYYDAHPPYGPPPGVTPPDRDDRTYYDEELAYLDAQLGRLIDAVDQQGYPTYLVLTADHATSFHPVPELRHWNYGYDIYTSTLHVPLLFHGRGLRTGQSDDVVSTMDVAPTLANLFGLETRGRFEGTSLAREILQGSSDPKRTLFQEYYLPENTFRGRGDPLEFVSIRSNQYDLILNRLHGTYELYDWAADYWEIHDLYEELARLPEVARLRARLNAFVFQNARTTPTAKAPIAFGTPSLAGRRTFSAVEP
jgi:arylsulfatase A-like enzyme